LLREIIDLFLETTSHWLSDFASPQITEQDAELLRRTAHTLKGSLSQLGALSARDVAQQWKCKPPKINSRLPLTP